MDELGGGRYRLGDALARRLSGGLFEAVDERLGRQVLVQYDRSTPLPASLAARLSRVEHPAVARVLDGGEEQAADGTLVSYLVYPASEWLPATRVPHRQWQTAAGSAARAATGAPVAPRNTDVIVDPTGGSGRSSARVQWLPSPAAVADLDRRPADVSRIPRRAFSVRRPPGRHALVGTVPAAFRKEVA